MRKRGGNGCRMKHRADPGPAQVAGPDFRQTIDGKSLRIQPFESFTGPLDC